MEDMSGNYQGEPVGQLCCICSKELMNGDQVVVQEPFEYSHAACDPKPTTEDEATAIRDLRLGDVVQLFDGPFSYSKVVKVADEWVELFRPYVMNLSCQYGVTGGSTEETGSIIHGTGFEQIKLFRDDTRKVRRVERGRHIK